jgi:hypothetical protein
MGFKQMETSLTFTDISLFSSDEHNRAINGNHTGVLPRQPLSPPVCHRKFSYPKSHQEGVRVLWRKQQGFPPHEQHYGWHHEEGYRGNEIDVV